MNKLSFHNKLVLRTPALPLDSDCSVEGLFKNEFIQEALFFASPQVSKLMESFDSLSDEKKERLIVTLNKYLIRMSTRCTPFGLFASSSILKIAEQTDIVLGSGLNRHTRLDMDFLNQIYLKLREMNEVRELMTYKPNSTIYTAGNHIKYTECKHIDFIKKHGLAKIDRNEIIDEILNFSSVGKTIEDIVNHLMKSIAFSEEEITGFIHVLIDNHILVANLEPNITGDHYSQRLLAFLNKIDNSKINEEVVHIKEILNNVLTTLDSVDQNTINLTSTYKRLISELKRIDISVDGDRYFQVDSTKKCAKNTISSNVFKKLQRGMKYLGYFQTKVQPDIENWKQKFKERYEDKPVSLLEALDPEIGLGYNDLESCSMPLLQEMNIGRGSTDQISHIEDLLLKNNNLNFNDDLIKIDRKDLKNFDFNFSSLPDTVTVLFKIIGDKILIKGFGGASGTEYIGRFTHLDDEISQLYNDLTTIEDSNSEHSILAEVLHIPQTKFANILHRKETRKYEIPILVHTDLNEEYCINPSDLYVKFKNDRLILFSKKHNCQIEPRISNAYNSNIQAIPIFKFLNDIQSQSEVTGYYFDWGDLQNQHVLFPRVEIDDVILAPKKWMFKNENLSALKESLKDEAQFKKFRSKFSIPDIITIQEGDNELLVNLTMKKGIDILKSVSKNKELIIFIEDLFEGVEQIVFDKNGSSYSNELIAFAINSKPKKQILNLSEESNIKYNFPFGSSWLYFKIFTSPKAADIILLELLNPIVDKLFNLGLIKSWFFIRYNLPDFHVRFRVKVEDVASIGNVINEITSYLNQFNSPQLIFKIETDTYKREVSRYGLNNIDNSETYFFYDSNLALQLLNIINEFHDSEGLRWQICMLGTHYILEEFNYSLEQKNDTLNYLREAYFREFDVSKNLKKIINNSFREKSQIINHLFNDESYKELHDIFLLKNDQTKLLVQEIMEAAEDLDLLLMSYIHMFINRILLDRPREHELILYDHLSRYYRSMLARSKNVKFSKNER